MRDTLLLIKKRIIRKSFLKKYYKINLLKLEITISQTFPGTAEISMNDPGNPDIPSTNGKYTLFVVYTYFLTLIITFLTRALNFYRFMNRDLNFNLSQGNFH